MGERSSKAYFNGLCTKNNETIKQIYEEFSPKVIRFIEGNSGTRSEAQDIMQEALLTIYQKYCADPEKWVSFGGLLMRIVRFKWMDNLKNKGREDLIKEAEKRYLDEQDINQTNLPLFNTDHTENHCWEKTFSQLTNLCQQVLYLKFAVGASGDDIAKEVSVSSKNTVYQRIFDCRNRWKQLYDEQCKN